MYFNNINFSKKGTILKRLSNTNDLKIIQKNNCILFSVYTFIYSYIHTRRQIIEN